LRTVAGFAALVAPVEQRCWCPWPGLRQAQDKVVYAARHAGRFDYYLLSCCIVLHGDSLARSG